MTTSLSANRAGQNSAGLYRLRLPAGHGGFTLVELLVSVAIIALLASLIVGAGFMWVQRSKEYVQFQNMESIVTRLQASGSVDGSTCAYLQARCSLGGVVEFAQLPAIVKRVRMGKGGDMSRLHERWRISECGGDEGRFFPPPIHAGDERSGVNSFAFFPSSGNDAGSSHAEYLHDVWRAVVDVLPPKEGKIPANYEVGSRRGTANIHDNWYVRKWPYVWPLTDWDQDSPGDIPPVLRFPWGTPGLRVDGKPVDPLLPHDETVGYLDEKFFGNVHKWDYMARYHPLGIELGEDDLPYDKNNIRKYLEDRFIRVRNAWSVAGWVKYYQSADAEDEDEDDDDAGDEDGDVPGSGGKVVGLESLNYDLVDSRGAMEIGLVPDGRSVYNYRSNDPASDFVVEPNRALPFDAGLMSPLATIRFFQVIGDLPPGEEGEEMYRADRHPGRPWNDRHGRPLVIGYALFQPERYIAYANPWSKANDKTLRYGIIPRNTSLRSFMLDSSKSEYGYNRCLYIIVGSVGPVLSGEVLSVWDGESAWEESDDAVVLRALWKQIAVNCRLHEWNEKVQAGDEKVSSYDDGNSWTSSWGDYRTGGDHAMESMATRVFEIY